MRNLLLVGLALLFTASSLLGQSVSKDVRTRVALALMVGNAKQTKTMSAGCECAPGCPCGPDCPCPSIPTKSTTTTTATRSNYLAPGPVEWALYEVQYDRAIRDNKPLLIWVGETCPACEKSWTNYYHARLSEYTDGNKGPCCIVGKPDGMGGLDRVATFPGIPSLPEVNAAIATNPRQVETSQPQFVIPPPIPMMMPMMGGFGGCAGGG